MYVCRWLYCSEGVFCVLCEFVPVCLPVISVMTGCSVLVCVCCRSVLLETDTACSWAPNGYSLLVGTKRIQPARGHQTDTACSWLVCHSATVGGTVRGNTVQIVSTYHVSPEARPPSFLGKPALRPRSMAGGAPTPCGRH